MCEDVQKARGSFDSWMYERMRSLLKDDAERSVCSFAQELNLWAEPGMVNAGRLA